MLNTPVLVFNPEVSPSTLFSRFTRTLSLNSSLAIGYFYAVEGTVTLCDVRPTYTHMYLCNDHVAVTGDEYFESAEYSIIGTVRSALSYSSNMGCLLVLCVV